MKRWVVPLLLAASVTVGAQEKGAEPEPQGFGDVEKWIERFESPERLEWQKPGAVVTAMGLAEGDRIADIGAGTGYFLPMISDRIGEEGKLYAVDIEPALLEHIEQREDFYHDNVVTVLAQPDDPKLPEGELDQILIVNTWHHIENRRAYLAKLARALNSRGRLLIVDWRKDELPLGPKPEHKLSRGQVLKEAERAGWTLTSESIALPYQYFLVLTPPR